MEPEWPREIRHEHRAIWLVLETLVVSLSWLANQDSQVMDSHSPQYIG